MFIKDSVCISPQNTFPSAFKEGDFREHNGNKYFAMEPAYDELISAGALRRMGKAIRMGVAAGSHLLKNHPPVDGIIIGTANGGLEDCIKFLNQIVDYQEGTLTPTNFVQSTPNAVAGQLAMGYQNTCYNITHAHDGLSFENALIDAALLFDQNEARSLLVGALEEISEYNYNIDRISDFFKDEMTSSLNLLASKTKGTVSGEGAVMFLLEPQQSTSDQIRIRNLTTIAHADSHAVTTEMERFLADSNISTDQIDALLLGYNGDVTADIGYDKFRSYFPKETSVFSFKNACGEYPTATSFAAWLGAQILAKKWTPSEIELSKPKEKKIGNILIYNQNRNIQHSFILLDVPTSE